MAGLSTLSCFTVWKTSTTPSLFNCPIKILRAQNTPVRPTPALKCEVEDEVEEENKLRVCSKLRKRLSFH